VSARSEACSAAVRSELSDVPLDSAPVTSAEAAVRSLMRCLTTMPSSLATAGRSVQAPTSFTARCSRRASTSCRQGGNAHRAHRMLAGMLGPPPSGQAD